jgi:putative transposase
MCDPRDISRRSTRLAGYDYASNGAYVVTLCSASRRPLFGRILDGEMRASQIGAIVEREWRRTEQLRPGVSLDAFALMPNHLHAILVIDLPGNDQMNEKSVDFLVPSRSLSAIVSGIKAAVSSAAVKQGLHSIESLWQRGFYDRIIRSESELRRFREYIANNPLQWELDRYFEREVGGAAS